MNWRHLFKFRASKSDFEEKIKSIVGFYPDDAFFYRLAFVHKSMVNSNKSEYSESNERLEFLGDSILSSAVSEHIFTIYPSMDEGELSNLRSKIVSRNNLNKVAQDLAIPQLVIAHVNETAMKTSVQGNALEALIGAVYLDLGYKKAKEFVTNKIINSDNHLTELIKQEVNYKSRILEWGQANKETVSFQLKKEEGHGHHKKFTVNVMMNNTSVAEGTGSSKKRAEQIASQQFAQIKNING